MFKWDDEDDENHLEYNHSFEKWDFKVKSLVISISS